MSKRIVVMLLALMCMVCGVAMAEGQRVVVATTYPLYDMAKIVCGDLADVQYVPEDAEKAAAEADVVFCVGGESDAWVDALADAKAVKAVYGLELIEGNADVLTIPVNCMISVSYFADAMSELDPDNIQVYQSNASSYIEAMIALDSHIREAVNADMKVKGADGSMAYFAREYGVTEAQDSEDAIELYTYSFPAKELLETPYLELMHSNLHLLAEIAD